MRSFMTMLSMSSWASVSVILPALRSRSMKQSRKAELRPNDMAAPSWDLMEAR